MINGYAVVVVAGGSGTRAGGEIPKQFQPLLGLPLLLWSVKFFLARQAITELVIVAHSSYLVHTEELLRHHDMTNRVKVVPGGVRRQDSVLAGVAATPESSSIVAIHDGARPFPPDDLERGVEAAIRHGGAIFATRVTDSIKRGDGELITEAVPRDDLWAAQTPQLARRSLLLTALNECRARQIEVTDEAGALDLISVRVAIVEGSQTNLKVTRPEDWLIAEAIARMRQNNDPKTGLVPVKR